MVVDNISIHGQAHEQSRAPLGLPCDGSHEHARWGLTQSGTFATAQEAEYPTELCAKYIELASTLIPSSRLQYTITHFRLESLRGSQIEAAGHHQAISDFHQVVTIPDPTVLPGPIKILSSPAGTTGEQAQQQDTFTVGIYKTYEQHLEAAFNLEHPMESAARLPEELMEAAATTLVHTFSDIVVHRVKQLKTCVDLAATLTQKEASTRAAMDSRVDHVTHTKKIELFRSLLQQIDFPHMTVVDLLQYGVKLTGWEPPSALYSKRVNPPLITEEMLDKQALWRRRAMMGKPMSEEESLLAPQLLD